jgi:hypothetical protein
VVADETCDFVVATPERLAELIGDFERIWPVQFGPAPRLQPNRLYKAGMMIWQEADRPGAVRAFRVISPDGLRFEHWFEVQQVGDGSILRHTILGETVESRACGFPGSGPAKTAEVVVCRLECYV